MSLELIMCLNGAIDHASVSPVSGGVFVITSIPSIQVKAEGYGVFRGPLVFTFTGGSATGFVSGTITGSGSITPTAIKSKANGLEVIREGDSVSVVFTGTTLPNPPGTSGTINGDVEVSDAGQTTSRAQ